MFKFLLGSEPIFLLVRTVSPQIRTKRPLYFDLGDLVGLGDRADAVLLPNGHYD